MWAPLEEGECDKIGARALDNGRRNEQVVKAEWPSLIPKEEKEVCHREGGRVTRLEEGAMRRS